MALSASAEEVKYDRALLEQIQSSRSHW
jgi:hypothetical protein